jgi:hypothetical protein
MYYHRIEIPEKQNEEEQMGENGYREKNRKGNLC